MLSVGNGAVLCGLSIAPFACDLLSSVDMI